MRDADPALHPEGPGAVHQEGARLHIPGTVNRNREMENISRGSTFGDFVTIRAEASMQDVTVARLQRTRVQTPISSLFKCNVLRENLSVDSQNHR